MLESEPDLHTHIQNLGEPLPKKTGAPKTTHFLDILWQLWDFTANIFATKHYTDNLKMALKNAKGFLCSPKFYEVWSSNG